MDSLMPNHALNNLQTLCSNITHRIPNFSSSIPNNNPFCSLSSSFSSYFSWKKSRALSTAEIKKRMVGIPVYQISNYRQSACGLVSDHDEDRVIELYYISKSDAEDYWHADKWVKADWHILDTPLTHVVDFEGDVPPIRLVPESSQVKNAIELRKKERKKDMADFPDESFSGVPVFQSDYLAMTNDKTGKTYRPSYLRKEDLEKNMVALVEPEYRDSIKVAAFEDIIQEMKDSSTSESNDVFFVGPGITSWTWF